MGRVGSLGIFLLVADVLSSFLVVDGPGGYAVPFLQFSDNFCRRPSFLAQHLRCFSFTLPLFSRLLASDLYLRCNSLLLTTVFLAWHMLVTVGWSGLQSINIKCESLLPFLNLWCAPSSSYNNIRFISFALVAICCCPAMVLWIFIISSFLLSLGGLLLSGGLWCPFFILLLRC